MEEREKLGKTYGTIQTGIKSTIFNSEFHTAQFTVTEFFSSTRLDGPTATPLILFPVRAPCTDAAPPYSVNNVPSLS